MNPLSLLSNDQQPGGRHGLGAAIRLVVLSFLLAGVASLAPGAEREGVAVKSSSRIQELHLFTLPVPLNLDSKPGPDGFEVRVYASTAEKAKGIPITQGTLDVLMWDGVVNSQASSTNKPLHVWSFKPEELKRNASQTSLGVGYRLVLRWDQDAPSKESITIVARFVPTKGSPVYSSPSGIPMAAK